MATQSKVQSKGLMDILIKLMQKTKTKILGSAFLVIIFYLIKLRNNKQPYKIEEINIELKKNKGTVNKQFFIELKELLKIALPNWIGKEILTLTNLSVFLILRTFLSIFIAGISGKIVKCIIDLDYASFIKNLSKLVLLAIPGSFINSYIEFIRKKISCQIRTNMTNYFMDIYLKNNNFFKLSQVDLRMQNIDQILTKDLEKWCNTLTQLFNNITKPILDIILFSKKLSEIIGYKGPLLIGGWYMVTVFFLRLVSPSFGKLVAHEQKLEGIYRSEHSNIVSHSEEIAFYDGQDWEKERLNLNFMDLLKHQTNIMYKRLYMGSIDSLLVKYGATICGYSIVGIPVFSRTSQQYLASINHDESQITNDYVRNSSLLIQLSKAIGRLIVSYKDIQELSGYTLILTKFRTTINDLNKGFYQQNQIQNTEFVKGNYIHANYIEFSCVDICTPKGDFLLQELQLKINKGMNVLVSGPNASGKSSMFRILSGIWPLFKGTIHKPLNSPLLGGVFYVPQKCYLPLGTLRDQVIYPHSQKEMEEKNISDNIMKFAHLDYIIEREGGLNSINDWGDVLSGGEKQRINLSRLFYHKPEFAVLDDCTSAVSMDVEIKLFEHIQFLGINIITVSHRQNITIFHNWQLSIDDKGLWTLNKI